LRHGYDTNDEEFEVCVYRPLPPYEFMPLGSFLLSMFSMESEDKTIHMYSPRV
jgi:hypothetical protein